MGCGASSEAQVSAQVQPLLDDASPEEVQAAPEATERRMAAEERAKEAAADRVEKVGKGLEYASMAVEKGAELVDTAVEKLNNATNIAAALGQSTDAKDVAKGVIDGIGALAGHDAVKSILAGGWVLVSESAQFFTIGKVAVSILEQVYGMWNSWSHKSAWMGEFIAFLKLVEIDLVNGMKTFEHVQFLQALERQLEETRELIQKIKNRGRAMSFVMAQMDQNELDEHRVKIDSRKQECLFGHAVDIKADTKAGRALMTELAGLMQQRANRLAALGTEEERKERAKRAKKLEKECAMLDPTADIARYQAMWMRHRRALRFKRMPDDTTRHAYVRQHLAALVVIVPTQESELRTALEANEDAQRAAVEAANSTSAGPGVLTADEKEAARVEIAKKERAAFETLAVEDRLKQLDLLKTELKSAVTTIGSLAAKSETRGDALLKARSCVAVLASLRNLALDDASGEIAGEATNLVQIVARVHRAQIDAGEALASSTPSLEELVRLQPVGVTPQERQMYVDEFRTYYATELAEVDWLLDTSPNAPKRTPDRPSKGGVLVIRAPAPLTSGDIAVGTKDVSCSIFLAFLVDLRPDAFRSLAFVPDAVERAREGEAHAARAAARNTARKLAFREAAAARNRARAERRRADPDVDSSDEAEGDDIEEEAWLETPEQATKAEATHYDAAAHQSFRRIFPSLAYQLATQAGFEAYYANLLVHAGGSIARAHFDRQEPADFFNDLFGAKWKQEGSHQTNPNASAEAIAAAAAAAGPLPDASKPSAADAAPTMFVAPTPTVRKVCVTLDAAQFATLTGEAVTKPPYEFNANFLKALDRNATSTKALNFPDWLCMVLTVPHAPSAKWNACEQLKALTPLQLSKHALGDEA